MFAVEIIGTHLHGIRITVMKIGKKYLATTLKRKIIILERSGFVDNIKTWSRYQLL